MKYGMPVNENSYYRNPEVEEKKEGIENLLKAIGTENFSSFERDMDIQIQEAQRTPNKLNQNIFSKE